MTLLSMCYSARNGIWKALLLSNASADATVTFAVSCAAHFTARDPAALLLTLQSGVKKQITKTYLKTSAILFSLCWLHEMDGASSY